MHDADRVVTQTSVALKIWNMDGTCLEFSRNDYLKLSPKAKFLAIYTDSNITIIDCLTGKTIVQRQLPNIKRICWNPQETMIATVNGNNIICIWDLKTCRPSIHSDNKIGSIAFNHSGDYILVTDSFDTELKIYNLLSEYVGKLSPAFRYADSSCNHRHFYKACLKAISYKKVIGNTVRPKEVSFAECVGLLKQVTIQTAVKEQ